MVDANFEPIVGRYLAVDIDGSPHRVHVEEAGQGVPLLCLHTAGADSRQYRHVFNDAEITDRFRVIAFDLPYHGRSTPADGWWLKKYRLTTQSYLAMIRAVWLKLGLARPVVMGCSMGGAIVLKVAAEYQEELTGIVGLESSAHAPGRYNEWLHHPAIHGGELAASYTYGLNAPASPEANRRENWWYYSQGGPGVYQGDVHFYSNDWDGREDIKRIDTNRCKVALLTGEYDYSCTPEMSEAVAAAIRGSRLTIMKGMGHFPMVENYPEFRPYLLEALAHVAGWPASSALLPAAWGGGWGVGVYRWAQWSRQTPTPTPTRCARRPSPQGGRVRDRARGSRSPQSPFAPWMSGKNMSCHFAGRCLIEPTSAMKFAYVITLSGEVVKRTSGSFRISIRSSSFQPRPSSDFRNTSAAAFLWALMKSVAACSALSTAA